MKTNIPCLKEQQKIADFLSKMDEKISNQEAVVSDYEEMKKGLMQKIFSQKVRFKADDGSEYPEWEEKKLLDVGMIITGTTPSTKIEEYYSDKYLWVTPADIEGKEISDTQKKLSEDGLKKGRIIPANSVLVTCIASIGKNAVLRERGSCNQQINAITPNNEYDVDFVYYLICFNENMLHANAGHGGMEILNKEQFSKLCMYFPCSGEQQKIADCLSAMDRKIEAEKKILEDWKELKKALLQQMFV
jgi:Restriction endonuclease S subunits